MTGTELIWRGRGTGTAELGGARRRRDSMLRGARVVRPLTQWWRGWPTQAVLYMSTYSMELCVSVLIQAILQLWAALYMYYTSPSTFHLPEPRCSFKSPGGSFCFGASNPARPTQAPGFLRITPLPAGKQLLANSDPCPNTTMNPSANRPAGQLSPMVFRTQGWWHLWKGLASCHHSSLLSRQQTARHQNQKPRFAAAVISVFAKSEHHVPRLSPQSSPTEPQLLDQDIRRLLADRKRRARRVGRHVLRHDAEIRNL